MILDTITYGWAKKEPLSETERMQIGTANVEPYSYQAIEWFTISYVPLVPLGTYRVVCERHSFWSAQRPRRYKRRVPWDVGQVIQQYAVVYGGLGLILWIALKLT